MKSTQYAFSKKIIFENIDLKGYSVTANTKKEKIEAVYNIFLSEYGHTLKTMCKENAFSEWLQGLPSVITVPFYNYEILEMAKESGLLKTSDEYNFLKFYWINLSISFFRLKGSLK